MDRRVRRRMSIAAALLLLPSLALAGPRPGVQARPPEVAADPGAAHPPAVPLPSSRPAALNRGTDVPPPAQPHLAQPHAAAGGMPRFFPTRDTVVEFTSDRSGELVRLTYAAAARRVRVERGQLGAGFAIVTWPTGHTILAAADGQTQEHADPSAVGLTFFDAAMRFQRLHEARIMGHTCTTWRVTQHDGVVVDACLTEDGVPLRVQQAASADAEIFALRAIHVGPVPESAVAVPVGNGAPGKPAPLGAAPGGAAPAAMPAWAGMPSAAALGGKPF